MYQGGTYFKYGEMYGNTSGLNGNHTIGVYTSNDFKTWYNHGSAFSDPERPVPAGIYYQPYVAYHPSNHYFVMYFNYYSIPLQPAWNGSLAVATSLDGIVFSFHGYIPIGAADVDGNAMFLDDDGTMYVTYSSIAENHAIVIEKAAPDWLSLLGIFSRVPGFSMEGSVLAKYGSTYFLLVGDENCTFCSWGATVFVFSAQSMAGPWVFLTDINSPLPSVATRSIRSSHLESRTRNLVNNHNLIPAQFLTLSFIPLPAPASGFTYLFQGERWTSTPDGTKGHDYQYFIPLTFGENGTTITHLQPFVDQWDLPI